MPMYLRQLKGRRFGMLTVVDLAFTNKNGSYWNCLCDCGKTKVVMRRNLIGKTKASCGCKGKSKDFTTVINSIYNDYKHRAKKKNLEFTINRSIFETLIKSPCYYCGELDSNLKKDHGKEFKYNGLDRVDNKKGYNLDNVVTCCKICNIAKSTLNTKDFTDWIKKVYTHIKNNTDFH